MRPIDADALLQYLQGKLSMFDSVEGKMGLVPTTIRNDLQGFVETILEQPTIPAPLWVGCEERLPEPGEYVLAWECQGFCVVDRYIDICGGRWGLSNDGAIYTHWMPLPSAPEPPREGE